MNKKRTLFLTCFVFFVNIASAVQNIDDLVSQGKLSISVDIDKSKQQIVGQALVLSIEVSTDRWFSTGSRIQNFNLSNVVMQANNIITINGSKRIQGQTWATQTHEITLYPTLAGNYNFPAINVDVSINTESDGIVSGVLSTPESSFIIDLPEELNGIDNFIVSPEVTLTVDGQFDAEKIYAIGEAITQTISITATDTPAMMIPELNFIPFSEGTNTAEENSSLKTNDKTKQVKRDGISIYRKPAQVFDKSNRGSLLGTRVESFTYIFEKSGSYVLPKQVIYWWNIQSNTLEELIIPSSSWKVSGGDLTHLNPKNITDIRFNLKTMLLIAASCLIFALAYFIVIKRQYLASLYKQISHYKKKKIRKRFLNSIAKKEYILSTQYLYQYALLIGKHAEIKSLSLTIKLNQLAFQADSNQNIQLAFPVSDAKALIKQIDTMTSKKSKRNNFSANEVIKLNHR
jgi:hypothetical protein